MDKQSTVEGKEKVWRDCRCLLLWSDPVGGGSDGRVWRPGHSLIQWLGSQPLPGVRKALLQGHHEGEEGTATGAPRPGIRHCYRGEGVLTPAPGGCTYPNTRMGCSYPGTRNVSSKYGDGPGKVACPKVVKLEKVHFLAERCGCPVCGDAQDASSMPSQEGRYWSLSLT